MAVAAGVVAATAWGGAVGLAEGGLSLGEELNARLPFGSPAVGGAALGAVVGVPFSALAAMAWRGDDRTDAAAVAAGAVLVGWIGVELAFIREVSFFHPLYAAIGLGFVGAGSGLGRRRC